MRITFFGFLTAVGLLAAPPSAATVTETTDVTTRTTDWTPFATNDPLNPQNVLLRGSQIFEEYTFQYSLPELDTGGNPFDWVHISYDLTMRVETRGLAGFSGSFHLYFPGSAGLELIASGGYDRTDGIWTSGKVQSVGAIALDSALFGLFAPGGGGTYSLYGGSSSYLDLGPAPQPYPSISVQERTRHTGTLTGSITVTAGYGGEAEPDLKPSLVIVSQVPLPASGLLLGTMLLAGIGLSRRRVRAILQS